MKSRRLIYPVLALALAAVACNLPGLPPVVTSPPVTVPPVTELPVTVPPVVTEPPIVVTEPPVSTALMPAGFIIGSIGDPVRLLFYDLASSLIGVVNAPSLQNAGIDDVFPVGGVSGGTLPAVVYYTYDGNNILINGGGVESLLATVPQFYAMNGAPAQPIIAYGTADMTSGGLNTSLFVGAPETVASSSPVLSYTDEPNGAIFPLHILMDGSTPIGIWFTKQMYGIGGDLVFAPTTGLFYLNLTSGVVSEFTLPSVTIYSPGVSPSANWMAYTDQGIGIGTGRLNIQQTTAGENHAFPLLGDSDRGAGGGVFSPDELHVAWMEGHGWTMAEVPDFRSTVRFGSTSGTTLADYPASMFDAAAGFSVAYARPVGWLDNETVLVQATGTNWIQNSVLRLDLSGNITFIGSGGFTGFTYP